MSVSKTIKSIKTASSTWFVANNNHVGTYYHLGSNDNWLFVDITSEYGGGYLLANQAENVEMKWEEGDAVGSQLASYLRNGAVRSVPQKTRTTNSSNVNSLVERVVNNIIDNTSSWKYVGELNRQVVFANKYNTDWVFVRDASTSNGGFIIRNNAKNIFVRYNEDSAEANRMWSALINLYSQTIG